MNVCINASGLEERVGLNIHQKRISIVGISPDEIR